MAKERCNYVAKEEEPETWHGDDPIEWALYAEKGFALQK